MIVVSIQPFLTAQRSVMSAPSNNENQPAPSQVFGNIKQYAGMAEETIGNAIGSQEWTEAGKTLKEQGIKEIQDAKEALEKAAPSKTNANINSVIGGVKEEVGNLMGSSNVFSVNSSTGTVTCTILG